MVVVLDNAVSEVKLSPNIVVTIDVSRVTSDAVVEEILTVAVVHVFVSDVEAIVGDGMITVEVWLMSSIDVRTTVSVNVVLAILRTWLVEYDCLNVCHCVPDRALFS